MHVRLHGTPAPSARLWKRGRFFAVSSGNEESVYVLPWRAPRGYTPLSEDSRAGG
jgi:hypothetical protein